MEGSRFGDWFRYVVLDFLVKNKFFCVNLVGFSVFISFVNLFYFSLLNICV